MDYTIKKTRRNKNIRLSINTKGEIVVSAPIRVSNGLISGFVQKHQAWIEDKLKKIVVEPKSWTPNQSITIFNKNYVLRLWKLNLRPKYRLTEDSLWLKESEFKHLEQTLPKILKSDIFNYFDKKLVELNQKYFQTSWKKLTIRSQKSRWGSYSSTGVLSLNWRLILAPEEILNYVIIHELAHIYHPNHSSKFWQLVGEYDPNFKIHRNWLKKNGNQLTP